MTSVRTVRDLAHAGRDVAAPFRLALPDRGAGDVDVEEIHRLLPGRRLVATVRAADGAVGVLKLFYGTGANRYQMRELTGVRLMRDAGLPTPEVVSEGVGRDGAYLMFRYLPKATPLPTTQEGLEEAAAMFARFHAAGLVHTDPHVDNFLKSEGALWVVDGDGVRRAPARARWQLDNLAQLCAQLPVHPAIDPIRALAIYRNAGDGGDDVADAEFVDCVSAERNQRLTKFLRKCERDCTQFHCRVSMTRFLICERAQLESLQSFIADPEQVIAHGQIVKAGNTATVVRCALGNRSVVVKRYNIKSARHRLWISLKRRSRGRLSWLNAQRLRLLGIPTAHPLLLLEERFGPMRGTAYLVMDDLGEQHLGAAVLTQGFAPFTSAASALFASLGRAGLIHGDAKATNFIVHRGDLHLIDLDAMRPLDGRTHARLFAKDIARFLENWDEHPDAKQAFANALPLGGRT